jgi:hypothetical protein
MPVMQRLDKTVSTVANVSGPQLICAGIATGMLGASLPLLNKGLSAIAGADGSPMNAVLATLGNDLTMYAASIIGILSILQLSIGLWLSTRE